MGYRNDQYFGLVNAGERGANIYGGTALTPALNKPFSYPDRTVRTNSVLNAGGLSVEPTLQRGYIRSIANSLGGVSLTQAKCNFQFNPRILNHSVNQNTKILDFLHQDASQYAQPIPGNVSFSFMLFFDRSMELNKGGPDTSGYDTSSDNPWERFGPETVGVLHDISALYSVIGQGIGAQQKAYIQSVLENQIKGEINSANSNSTVEVDDDGNETVIGTAYDTTELDNYSGAAEEFINELGNFGNVAFLLPLPVRVVFSSLYIVEGLVQNASTKFTKFNSAMVPMQATVELTMEAKYIGFAKKNTFFTEVLAKREEAALLEAERIKTEQEEVAVYADAAYTDLSKVNMKFSVSGRFDRIDEAVSSGSSADNDNASDLAKNISSQLSVSFPQEEDGGKIRSLYASGATVEVAMSARLQIWRYTPTFRANNQDIFNTTLQEDIPQSSRFTLIERLEDAAAQSITSPDYYSDIEDLDGNVRQYNTVLKIRENWIEPSFSTGTATTLDEFKDMADGGTTGDVKGAEDRSVTDPRYIASHTQFWFAVLYEISISLTVDGVTTNGTGSYVQLNNATGGDWRPNKDIEVEWSDRATPLPTNEGVVI